MGHDVVGHYVTGALYLGHKMPVGHKVVGHDVVGHDDTWALSLGHSVLGHDFLGQGDGNRIILHFWHYEAKKSRVREDRTCGKTKIALKNLKLCNLRGNNAVHVKRTISGLYDRKQSIVHEILGRVSRENYLQTPNPLVVRLRL